MDRLIKFLATAGGLGYLPAAPGTAGSALGLLLGLAGLPPVLLVGAIGLAVAVSTAAERVFARHDPPCIVIDEVVGMWLVVLLLPHFSDVNLLGKLFVFGLFRAFDILKPPPLKRLAKAPAGWGIVLDDIGAAVWTVAVLRIAGSLYQVVD